MTDHFAVAHLDVERLLQPVEMALPESLVQEDVQPQYREGAVLTDECLRAVILSPVYSLVVLEAQHSH